MSSTSPRPALAERFTVIHGGGEIDENLTADLLDAVSAWATAPQSGVPQVVEVWGPPWKRLLAGCLTTAAAGGGPFYVMSVPAADDLVARVKARGVTVRYRRAWQSVVDDAELRAISQGWPVRYC
jgi:hypothetical protein